MCILMIMNKKIVLDVDRIILELKVLDRTKAWLARQLGLTPGAITHAFHTKSLFLANRIGKVLNIDPKFFVTTEDDKTWEK